MNEFNSILSALPNCSREELRQINTRLAFLSGREGEDDSDVRRVYDQIRASLRAAGVGDCQPYSRVRQSSTYSLFARNVELLNDFLRSSMECRTRMEIQRATQILVSCVIRYLRDRSIPVSLTTIIKTLSKVGEVVDAQFPGYGESGLLYSLLRATPTPSKRVFLKCQA